MMEQHNKLQMYVGFAEGGCQDVATVKLEGFTLVDSKQLAALIAERDTLKQAIEFLNEKIAATSAYCQLNNIGDEGDWIMDALTNHCDALAAQNAALISVIDGIRNRSKPSGFGSQTAIQVREERLAWMRLNEVTSMTPQQALAEIRAEAGRAGFVAGAQSMKMAFQYGGNYKTQDKANQYAEQIRQGGTK